MCSIGESDFGDDGGLHSMDLDLDQGSKLSDSVGQGLGETGTCSKCGQEDTSVYRLSARQCHCRECFLAYVRHKFRATLGSSKVLPREAKILLVVDGSPESRVLLDMLYQAQTETIHKRLSCSTWVLYIDEHIEMAEDERRRVLEDLQRLCAPYKEFQCYIVPLGCETDVGPFSLMDENVNLYLERNKNEEIDFLERVQSIHSATSRHDFLKYHRKRLIAQAAKHLNCSFVFTSDISVKLASDLLAAIALGRGGSAALDVALVDDRCYEENIKQVRPLKDINEKEIELYLSLQDIKPFPIYARSSKYTEGSSLQNLTEAFVRNLQQNYSSTVSTIYRTGDKIAPKYDVLQQKMSAMGLNGNEETPEVLICDFCKSPLDCAGSTTLLAIEFSRSVSEAGITFQNSELLREKAQRNLQATGNKELARLCHSCRNIQNESSGNVTLSP